MEINTNIVEPEAERIVREIGIPPCPQVLAEVMTEVRSDSTNLNRISHLISKDVGLSAAVLKTANSAFYGLRHKAQSIQAALSAVGLVCAANLIAGLMLRRAFASINHSAMNEFWESTSRVSLLAAYLGRELGVASLNEAHTYALFRDCGAPLLMHKYPDYGDAIKSEKTQSAQYLTDVERARYGTHHAAVGATLAMSWYLPEEIWQSIQIHHARQEVAEETDSRHRKTATLVALGIVADGIYREYRGIAASGHQESEEELALAVLGVQSEEIEPLQTDISRILQGH